MRKNLVVSFVALIWFGCAAVKIQAQDSPTPNPEAAKAAETVSPPQNLMIPPLAYDDTSITVIWSKPADYSNVVSYNVYQDGTLAGNTKNLFLSIKGLEPASPYSYIVKAVDASGEESQPGNKIIQTTAPAMKVFNVSDFGAVGDGNTLNTKAIQKAIDECTEDGKVLIPAGTFVSGALFLKSNMTLQIDGTLRGSDNAADYPLTSKRFSYYMSGNNYMGLLNAYTDKYGSITNVRICGSGTVNGGSDIVGSITGHKNTKLGDNQAAAANHDSARADTITVKGVDGLYIGGLTFVNPAMHVMFISFSKNITISGIKVDAYDIHNADGIDLATSDTAYIFDSYFDAGDDCINFNAGVGADGVRENFPDTNIRVFNCTTKRGHGGVVFGSFTAAWIQNVLVEDCVFDGTDIGIRFKTGAKQGGGARNVLCRDLIVKNTAKHSAIFFDSTYSCDYPSGGQGQFKDITIKNVACTNLKRYGIYVNGQDGMPHTNLSLSNVTIDGAALGGAYLKYCTNSSFEAIDIKNSSPVWTIDSNSTSGLAFKNCSPSPDNQAGAVKGDDTAAADRKTRIVLVGDSTVSDKQGWGPGFKSFLTDRAECINAAVGGRSSKSFISEGRWIDALALKGDYYLIQFGHNDEPNKGERSTDPGTTYREFMSRYIDEARAIGAKPVLVTSLVRRQWDKSGSGKINSSLVPYVEAVKELAKEKNVPLIDLHAGSKNLCEQMGKEKCNQFSPLKDDNQIDNTHLNSEGSVLFARLVVEGLVETVPELKPYVRSEPAAIVKTTAEVTVKNPGPSADNKPQIIGETIAAAEMSAPAGEPAGNIRIVIVGDTTAKDNKGWGPGFKSFLTERAECTNLAVGGRSSKKFIDEGRWTKALALKGDYYLIQFGHNDESAKDDSKTDPNTTYREYIKRYVDETVAAGAKPILVTSLVRRQWSSADPNIINSPLAPYAEAVRAIAKEKNVPLVDLHDRSKELCEKLGKAKCDALSPLKDDGKIDNTHLTEESSVIFGKLVVEELIKAVPELKPYFQNLPAADANAMALP